MQMAVQSPRSGVTVTAAFDTKPKAVFTVQKFFYLVILISKESVFLAIGDISKVYLIISKVYKSVGRNFKHMLLSWDWVEASLQYLLDFRVIFNEVFWALV